MIWGSLRIYAGFPGGSSGKEPACQCRRRYSLFDPWVRKIPWRRAWQPSPVFLPGESHGQRSLAGRCSYQVLPGLEEAALKASWYMCDGGGKGGGLGRDSQVGGRRALLAEGPAWAKARRAEALECLGGLAVWLLRVWAGGECRGRADVLIPTHPNRQHRGLGTLCSVNTSASQGEPLPQTLPGRSTGNRGNN